MRRHRFPVRRNSPSAGRAATPFMIACESPQWRSLAAPTSATSVTWPVSGSMPTRRKVPATLAHTRPAAQSRSFSPSCRVSPDRTLTSPVGRSDCGSRLTSSLLPSLVKTCSPARQMPQPSRL